MDICAFTHEHPGTRRCTIHPRTLTTTLIRNKTNHCISAHIWISLATVCLVPCHRRADFERIYCSERAPKRRSCRLKRRSFLREKRRPTRLQRCPGRSTCRWKVVIRTLELLGEIRERLEDFSENGVKSLHVVSYLFAEQVLARLTLESGRRTSSTPLASARVVTSAHFHDTSLRGRVYHSMDSARRDVAWPALSPALVAKRLHFVGFRARVKVHRLCNLVLSQPIPTDVSSHSMADSLATKCT